MRLNFAKKAPQGIVYAFEPTQYAMLKLQKNLKLNSELSKIIIPINVFVADQDSADSSGLKAFASWKLEQGKSDSFKHPIHKGILQNTEGVSSIKIDTFCNKNSIKKLDVIKIDTDGNEYKVLVGAKETIKELRPQVIFEIGSYVLNEEKLSFSLFHDFFTSLNYKMYNSITGQLVDISNYKTIIPLKTTIDIIAIPA